jgi:hypothetical protein
MPGIGNRPDPNEQRREEKRNNPFGLNPIDKMMLEHLAEFNKARDRYTPVVTNLNDIEFSALYDVVLANRNERIARLMVENPTFRKLVIDDLVEEAERQEQLVKDQGN